jgi:hypothetical protein
MLEKTRVTITVGLVALLLSELLNGFLAGLFFGLAIVLLLTGFALLMRRRRR